MANYYVVKYVTAFTSYVFQKVLFDQLFNFRLAFCTMNDFRCLLKHYYCYNKNIETLLVGT